MKIHIKILRDTYERAREDLKRPHSFAAERVGFFSSKRNKMDGTTLLVFLIEYHPIPDDQYIDDPDSGARINGTAIREAVQRALDTGNGVFHVHEHPGRGIPQQSPMDREELPQLIPSFQAAAPNASHGVFLLSQDKFSGLVWMPGERMARHAEQISVVGFPLTIIKRQHRVH